jgi:hypothetical protein
VTDAAESQPRRALFGIAREEYERLRAELDEQRAATERAEAVQAHLEARDRAREARVAAALGDAAETARGLPRTVAALARYAAAEEPDEQALTDALHSLLGSRAARVEALPADQLPEVLATRLEQRDDAVTIGQRAAADAEIQITRTAARVGEVAIVVEWAEEVFDDHTLRPTAEHLCRAAAASLAGRAAARDRARRQPISLLGDGPDAARLEALLEAQGQPAACVDVNLAPDAPEAYSGIFGEPAWDGERFHLAQALDRGARKLGGEAFEVPDGFACVVPQTDAEAMRACARALLEASSVAADVLEP